MGSTVAHKGLRAGLEDMSISWIEATGGGEHEVDEEWRAAQEQGMFSKAGVAGSWAHTWKNKATGREEKWYYTFAPVEGTPYMLALAVFEGEVTRAADEMLASLQRKVTIAAAVTAALIAVGCVGLAGTLTWFNKTLSRPLKELADYIGGMHASEYCNAMTLTQDAASSLEMREIIANMERMLVALRFCNPGYSKGNLVLEMDSCFDALQLCISTHNAEGEGICLNNMGNLCRAMTARGIPYSRALDASAGCLRIQVPGPCDSEWLFNKALALAQGLPDGPEKSNTVASRGFNLALNKVLQHPASTAEATDVLHNSLCASTSPETMARLCFAGISGAGAECLKQPQLMEELAEGALTALRRMALRQTNPPEAVAEACAVLCFKGLVCGELSHEFLEAHCRARIALQALPSMSPAARRVLLSAALHGVTRSEITTLRERLKFESVDEELVATLGFLAEAPPPYRLFDSNAPSKSVLFCIDVSGSMDIQTQNGRTRLDVCKLSLLQAFEKTIAAEDELGLYTFSSKFKAELPVQTYSPSVQARIKNLVGSMKTGGMTAFWNAVRQSMNLLRREATSQIDQLRREA
eukprot:2401490-Rhodomonas_salina.1